jgi:predicted GNAT family acetyltransferase
VAANRPGDNDRVTTDVRTDEQAARYEILVDGQVAGFVTYRDVAGSRALLHTEVDPAFEGRGLASRLIQYALDDVRHRGLGLLPHCPFVRDFVAKRPTYADLVPEKERARFGLAPATGPAEPSG